MIRIKRSTAGLCVVSILTASVCSATQHTTQQAVKQAVKQADKPPVEIDPSDAPTSAPRIEADESVERFVARWNAWVDSVPEDQRVGDAIERASERINEKLSQMSSVDTGYFANDEVGLAEPGDKFWREAKHLFQSIEPELDLMCELAQRQAVALHVDLDQWEEVDAPFCFQSYSWSTSGASYLLGYRARYLVLAGRANESVDDLRAIFEIERLAMESPALSGWTRAGAVRNLAWNTLRKTLVIDPDAYTDGQLAEFQSRLVDWIERDVAPLIKAEEYFAILGLRALYSDSVDGKLSEEKTLGVLETYASSASMFEILGYPVVFGYNPTKKRASIEFAPLDQQLAMLKASSKAFIADINAYPPTVTESHLSRLANDLYTNHDAVSLMPSLQFASLAEMMVDNRVINKIELRATVAVLAIHRHRLATGRWPKSLEEISAEHLRIDPIDLHTGDPFGYTVMNDRPRLWSGGPDGDNDEGTSVKPIMKEMPTEPNMKYEISPHRAWFTISQWDALSEEDQAKYDGDWILYPPKWEKRWGNEKRWDREEY